MLDLILFNYLLFAHDFECIDLLLVLELYQFDSAEGAVAQCA